MTKHVIVITLTLPPPQKKNKKKKQGGMKKGQGGRSGAHRQIGITIRQTQKPLSFIKEIVVL